MKRAREGETAAKMEVTALCNLITEVTPHHSDIFYLLEAKSSTHTKEKDSTRGEF